MKVLYFICFLMTSNPLLLPDPGPRLSLLIYFLVLHLELWGVLGNVPLVPSTLSLILCFGILN